MNTIQRTKPLTPVVASLAILCALATTARADVITQTLSQGLGTNWNQATWGTPASIPFSTNDYVTPAGFDVRTLDSQTASAFLGNSLQIEAGGRLFLKNGGAGNGVATANLILNGGSITYNTANGTTISAVAGTLNVAADSTVNSLAGANTRDVWLRSAMSGSGNLTIAMVNNALVLYGTNTAYSGNWTVNSGRIEVGSNALNPLGSGSVYLSGLANSLVFNSTNDLSLNNTIDGFGAVVKANTNTVTLAGNNPLAGSVVASNGVLRIGNASAIASVSVITLAGGTLDASLIGGLVLNEGLGQVLNCRGNLTGNLTAGTANTLNFNLTPLTNDILNISGSLTLNGNPTLNLNLAGFKPSGTYRLINYAGTIQGGGAFNLVPPAGSPSTFQLDTSTPGQVNLIIIAASQNLTWVGDGGGNAWDTFSPNWTGTTTTFALGDNVTFNDSGSAVPDIYVAATVNPNTMTVSNNSQSYTFYGESISTFATLTKAGTNVLAFTNPGNNFTGPVDIRAGTLSIGAGGSFGSIGAPSEITNNGLLKVNFSSGGTAIDAPISGSGAVEVTGGGGSLILRGTNSYTGLTTIDNECQLNITTSNALGTTDAGTVVLANGRLGVNSFVGSLTVPEPLIINGVGITAAPGALYLNTDNNQLTYSGPVTIASNARFRVVNPSARMTFANAVTGIDVALQCTAGNAAADLNTAIVFQNTFSLGNGALTKDGQGVLEFDSNSNVAGSTIVNGGTLRANGQFNGGPVAVNTTATLSGSGTILGPVAITDGATLAPGNAGIGTLTLNSILTFSPTAGTVMEINRTNAQNADLLVAPAVPFAGTLSVVNLGPALEVGDTFNLFDGTLSGAFSATNLPALALPGHKWDTSLLASQGIIKVATNVLPVLPLQITDIERQPGNVTLTWNSYPGQSYTVEYSLDLQSWGVLQANIPGNAQTNSTTAVVDTSGSGSGANITLAQYQLGSANAQIQDPANLVAAGALTAGSGVNLFNINAVVSPNYASAPVLQAGFGIANPDLATAVANQTWFTFQLTVGSSVTDLDLTSLTFNGARGGGAAPRGYGVYVTTPTTTDESVQGAKNFITQRPTWDPQNINLTGLASLQNLTAGQVITFKVPFYAPSPGNSVEFDDLTIKGNVTPGPLPPYAGASKLFLRIKKQ